VLGLVLAAIVAFKLQRKMMNVELGLQQMAHVGEHSIAIRTGCYHRMR